MDALLPQDVGGVSLADGVEDRIRKWFFSKIFFFSKKKKGKEKRYGSPLATDTGSTNQELDSFFCCFVDGVSS